MISSRLFTFVLSAAAVVLATEAHAEKQTNLGNVARFLVQDAETITITVHPTVTTKLRFDSAILEVHTPPWEYFQFHAQTDRIHMQPKTLLDDGRGIWGSFQVETRFYGIHVVVHATADPAQAHGLIDVTRRSQVELEQSNVKLQAQVATYSLQVEQQASQLEQIQTRLSTWETLSKRANKHVRALQQALTTVTTERDKALDERNACKAQLDISVRAGKEKDEHHALDRKQWQERDVARARQQRLQRARELVAGGRSELYPVYPHGQQPAGDKAHVRVLVAMPEGDGLVVQWRLTNPEDLPLDIVQIRQTSPHKRVLDMVEADVAGRDEGELTTVAPHTSVEGFVVLPEVTNEDLRSFGLAFITDTNRQITASGIKFYPMPDDELEAQRRDKEAQGRVTIQAVGLAGAVWLANPLDEKELGAATLWGGGLRAGYGFNRFLSLEGELVGGWSENARFEGTQGELTRAAKLGRVSAGLLVQLGYAVIPTLRVGLGVQGVSHDAQMEGGPAPDVGLEVDGVWYLSGGVGLRITKELKLGAEVSFIGQATKGIGDGTSIAFQGGIHAAWSWKP